ncbi:MAG: biotin/lipoyl-containing protein [Anaerovoracaceae bacterium]
MNVNNLLELLEGASKLNVESFEFEEDGSRIAVSFTNPNETRIIEKSAYEEVLPVEQEETAKGNIIKAPLVGTFYSAHSEEGPDFVKVGDIINEGQTVGIVEAMKLMNEIQSGFEGKIVNVFVSNGEMVEYGQPLFEVV